MPLDICSADEKRAFDNVERIDDIFDYVHSAHCAYRPKSFWEEQEYYVQMLVEKSTLKGTFPIHSRRVFLRPATASGWSDIHIACEHDANGSRTGKSEGKKMRAALLRRP